MDNKLVTTYCAITGEPLGQTEQLFPTEKLNIGKHPIFNKNLLALESLQFKTTRKNHKQRNMLALAYITNLDTMGKLLTINHPIQFPELALKRNYAQIIWICQRLATYTPDQKHKLFKQLPKFNTNACVPTRPVGRDATYCAAEMQTVGASLLTYITDTLMTELAESSTIIDDLFTLDEDSELATLLSIELADKIQSKSVNYSEYWKYMLEEIADQYGLNADTVRTYSHQLTKPTDRDTLIELRTYLQGLKNMAELGKLVSIPALQYKQAISELNIKIAEFNLVASDFELSALAGTMPVIELELESDDIDFSMERVVTKNEAIKDTSFKLKAPTKHKSLAGMSSKLDELKKKQQAIAKQRKAKAEQAVAKLAARMNSL